MMKQMSAWWWTAVGWRREALPPRDHDASRHHHRLARHTQVYTNTAKSRETSAISIAAYEHIVAVGRLHRQASSPIAMKVKTIILTTA